MFEEGRREEMSSYEKGVLEAIVVKKERVRDASNEV